jgi:N-acyl-D-aspartate/D-glutamate deacylase
MRDEGNRIIESVKEIFSFVEKSNCKVQISHLKVCGKNNWYKNHQLLELIDTYNRNYDFTFDAYPYTLGSTTLLALLPPYLLKHSIEEVLKKIADIGIQKNIESDIENGLENWENYAKTNGFDMIYPNGLECEEYKKYEGKTIKEISCILKKSAVEILCDILIKEKGKATMLMDEMSEDNIIELFKHPKHMVGSDALFSGKPHPRTFGTYPRVISRFCKEKNIFDLMTCLYKMSYFPAKRFNVSKRGEIKKNYFADLVIFDYDKIKDKATYDNPLNFSEGINYVISEGKILNLVEVK